MINIIRILWLNEFIMYILNSFSSVHCLIKNSNILYIGLKIQISHCGEAKRKYRVFSVTREPACILTFPMTRENGQSEEITVQKYFLEKYKRHLMYV